MAKKITLFAHRPWIQFSIANCSTITVYGHRYLFCIFRSIRTVAQGLAIMPASRSPRKNNNNEFIKKKTTLTHKKKTKTKKMLQPNKRWFPLELWRCLMYSLYRLEAYFLTLCFLSLLFTQNSAHTTHNERLKLVKCPQQQHSANQQKRYEYGKNTSKNWITKK